jgi:hypothetical protein
LNSDSVGSDIRLQNNLGRERGDKKWIVPLLGGVTKPRRARPARHDNKRSCTQKKKKIIGE